MQSKLLRPTHERKWNVLIRDMSDVDGRNPAIA